MSERHLDHDAILEFRLGCNCGNDQEGRLSITMLWLAWIKVFAQPGNDAPESNGKVRDSLQRSCQEPKQRCKKMSKVQSRTYPSSLFRIWPSKSATALKLFLVHCHMVTIMDSAGAESFSLSHLLRQGMLLVQNSGS